MIRLIQLMVSLCTVFLFSPALAETKLIQGCEYRKAENSNYYWLTDPTCTINRIGQDSGRTSKPENVLPPVDPVDPEEPTDPTDTTEPEEPSDPETPVEPEDPVDPGEPTDPEGSDEEPEDSGCKGKGGGNCGNGKGNGGGNGTGDEGHGND